MRIVWNFDLYHQHEAHQKNPKLGEEATKDWNYSGHTPCGEPQFLWENYLVKWISSNFQHWTTIVGTNWNGFVCLQELGSCERNGEFKQ